VKLYKILFEQEQLKLLRPEEMKAPPSAFNHIPSNKTDFNGPEFGLFDWKDGYEMALALVHLEKYKQYVRSTKFGSPTFDWICAYAGSTKRHSDDCNGAAEISYMARNPSYPGAGITMYALFSDYLAMPITSDRGSSTSNSAKQAWAKIENSSEWQKFELDNWKTYMAGETGKAYKKWYKFKGTWPNRSVTSTDEQGKPAEAMPHTPDNDYDDCNVPKAGTDTAVNKLLGTSDAWLYMGSLNSGELLDRGNDAIQELVADGDYAAKELQYDIKKTANKLFTKYYKGVEG